MHTLAFALIALSMLLALAASALAGVTVWAPAGVRLARRLRCIENSNLLLTLFLALASLFLLRAFIISDFSLVYVANYSDRALPLFYRITAFWAGQAGSMLFWALSVAICGAAFQMSPSYKSLSEESRLWYWLFYLALMAFFGLLLATWNNPFIVVDNPPADGNGLNPLLQNPGMIFHPPLLLLGYGGFVIPGCLALAQSLSRTKDEERHWIELSRPFTLSGWAFLTAGIVLGAWWAYMELGWGGYWAWDPVENASLIPWLTATAAIHTMIIQVRRDKLHGTNVFLMALTTISALFATYLVRSGVVQSVHAFGQGDIGGPLLVFILCSTVVSLWIALAARKKDAQALAGIESREGFLVFSAWLLLALAVIILLATLWPVLTAFWQDITGATPAGHDHGGAVGLTAAFYNRVCMPLFAALIVMLAVCPCLGWTGGLRHKRHLFIVLGAFIVAASTFYGMGYTMPVALLGMAGGLAAVVSLGLRLSEKSTRAYRPSLVAHGVHLGLAIIAIGIAFSGPYATTVETSLGVGEKVEVGPYEVELRNLYEGQGAGYVFLEAELAVSQGGSEQGIASPQRRIYEKWGQMQFAEASTIPSLGSEFYASLLALDGNGKATLSLSAHPLVNWLWIGGAIMCLLPFFGLRGRTTARSTATTEQAEASDKKNRKKNGKKA